MKIIIDTNVIIAGMLKDSIVRFIIYSSNFKFFLPKYAIFEIRKDLPEMNLSIY